MTTFSRTARAVTVAAVVGLSMGVSAPAVLAQPVAPAPTQVAKANIDFTKKGSLTLFKKKGAESNTPATGKEMEGVSGEALNGVTFKITKLNFDLQNGDWTKFPKTAADVKDSDKTTTTYEKKTSGQGEAKFSDLPLGIYLVEETNAPDGIVSGAPFIVSIPMVNEASDAWNYDVIAYPKNSETKTEKTVKDADKHIQDAYTYTINADAPKWGEGKKLTAFRFEDQLDKRLDFQKVTEVKTGGTTLTANTDYTVNKPAENGNKLVVKLTEQGLAKVKSGDKLSLTFDVKRKEVGDTTELKNQADVIFNNPNTGNEVKNKTNEVVTYHGKLKVVKKDGKETGKVLEGAEFELYQCTSATDLGAKVEVKNVSKWTTGADGTFSIDGLHVTDFEDNKEAPATKKFCLKETKAPAGYELPKENVTVVDFTRDNIAKTGEYEGDDKVTLVSQVDNIKRDTPNLPMTGGAGVGILGAIGALIAGAGVWFARRNAKKAQAE